MLSVISFGSLFSPYFQSLGTLPVRVITLIDPILPSEGLSLKNLVPISERQGPVMGGFEH